MFQVLLASTGAGKVVKFVNELLTPGGPSPMQILGIPRVSFPLIWPMQGLTPVPFSSSYILYFSIVFGLLEGRKDLYLSVTRCHGNLPGSVQLGNKRLQPVFKVQRLIEPWLVSGEGNICQSGRAQRSGEGLDHLRLVMNGQVEPDETSDLRTMFAIARASTFVQALDQSLKKIARAVGSGPRFAVFNLSYLSRLFGS